MSNRKMIVYHQGVPIIVEPLDALPPEQLQQQLSYPPPTQLVPQQPQYPVPYHPAPYRSEAQWSRQPDANGASGVAWKAILIFVGGWVPAFAFEAFGLTWLIWGLGGCWLAFRAGRRD